MRREQLELIKHQERLNQITTPFHEFGGFNRTGYNRARREANKYIKNILVRESVFSRDGYKCVYCGSQDNLTIDHIVNVYRGGENNISNLQTLCRACNSAKRT